MRGGEIIDSIATEIKNRQKAAIDMSWTAVHHRRKRKPLPRMKCSNCGLELEVEPKLSIIRCPVCRAVSFPCGRCRTAATCEGPSECCLPAGESEAVWSRKETR